MFSMTDQRRGSPTGRDEDVKAPPKAMSTGLFSHRVPTVCAQYWPEVCQELVAKAGAGHGQRVDIGA